MTACLENDLAAAISSVEIRHFRYRCWYSASGNTVYFRTRAPHRDTGEMMSLAMSHDVGDLAYRHAPIGDAASDVLFDLFNNFAEHEAEESFHLDGLRFKDPHAGEDGVEDRPHPVTKHRGVPLEMPRAGVEDALHRRLTAFIPRIEVRHLLYPVRWRVTAPGAGAVAVTLIGGVLDRDTGVERDAVRPLQVPPDMATWGDERLADFFLGMLRDFMSHEAAEAFHRDGVRVRDPHLTGAP